jgi:hypothetical protein
MGPAVQILHFLELVSFLGAFANLRKATISFVMCVCPSIRASALKTLVSTEQTFIKFDIWVFFENMSRKLIFIKP